MKSPPSPSPPSFLLVKRRLIHCFCSARPFDIFVMEGGARRERLLLSVPVRGSPRMFPLHMTPEILSNGDGGIDEVTVAAWTYPLSVGFNKVNISICTLYAHSGLSYPVCLEVSSQFVSHDIGSYGDLSNKDFFERTAVALWECPFFLLIPNFWSRAKGAREGGEKGGEAAFKDAAREKPTRPEESKPPPQPSATIRQGSVQHILKTSRGGGGGCCPRDAADYISVKGGTAWGVQKGEPSP